MQLELEDLGVKVFVPAKTPLLASMGRWVILSNSNSDIRNSVEKRENKDESTDRDVHRQTTSSKARSQHVSLRIPRYVLVGDEERVMMRTPAANLVSSHCIWSSTTILGATPSNPLYSSWSPKSSSEISFNQLSNTFYRCVCPETRNARHESHRARYLSGLCSTIPSLLVAYCKQTRRVLRPTHVLCGEALPQNLR